MLSTHLTPQARTATIDRLRVAVHPTVEDAGAAAAVHVATTLRHRLAQTGQARIIFAAAPSQDAFLRALQREPDIDWSRVTAFQMDEYLGITHDHPQAFGTYLDTHIYSALRLGRIHRMHPTGSGEDEAERYAALLLEARIDVVCLGIGENGHIAFNDPSVADLDDPVAVKVVELARSSRKQQVNDGCFPSLQDVPTRAITATVPALLGASAIVGNVSGTRKRDAVERALYGAVSSKCPASALRNHPDCTLFLAADAAPERLRP